MSQDWSHHAVHAALHEKDSKLAAVVLIVVGFAFTPLLIGIPIMLIGIYRLFK